MQVLHRPSELAAVTGQASGIDGTFSADTLPSAFEQQASRNLIDSARTRKCRAESSTLRKMSKLPSARIS